MGEPAEKPESRGEGVLAVAKWREPEGLEPAFVEHLMVQRLNDKYYLTFGRIEMPLSGISDKKPEVWVQPVGRFVVPEAAMRTIRDLLNRFVDSGETQE